MNKVDPLKELLKELTDYYEHHTYAPGIICSWLPEEIWYMAIHIFPLKMIESRRIIAKITDNDFDSGIRRLREVWVSLRNYQ